jgi:hypothetical protein
MAEAQRAVEKRPVTQPPSTEDLSEAIEQMMDRRPDEQVRCVRVFEDRYRCNWWVRGLARNWLSGATSSVRKSIFLSATRTPNGLVIEDLTG